MIDFNFENTNEPDVGSILISEPFIEDKYFTRSVILLCDHGEEGSFGFVLNNYIETGLKEMIADFPDIDVRVGLGGPVDTSNLFFIHSLPDDVPDSQEIAKGMYIGGKFSDVVKLLSVDPSKVEFFRFFVGYSGWETDQLNDELKDKSWLVMPEVPNKYVLDQNNDDLWKELMDKLGGKFKVMSTFPKNPSHN
ncbi:MAG: putative transcriptional regulator [Flavobacteriaceae bacterium]